MKYVNVGGARISAIGLGTWQFGSREWGYGPGYARHEALDIANRALDLGVNLIDTAEIYAFGQSERIVGQAVAARRDEAFLATKVFPVAPLAPVVEQRGKASAKRLGVDRIDLYQVHWPNPVFPLGPTMAGMEKLQRSGLVTHVGVSNFSLAKWKSAEAALGGPVLTNQVQFSLAHLNDPDLLAFATDRGRVIIAYSPLAQGLLSGKYNASNRPSGARAANSLFLPENLAKAAGLLGALADVARAHDATSSQVALAWVIHHPNVVAIPGASSVAQLESNVAAAELELSEDEFSALSAAAGQFTPTSGMGALFQMAKARLGAH
ncbi:MAG: aldo/keto reductase [Acidimicrobiales bacterium]